MKKIVIKIGSSIIAPAGKISYKLIADFIDDIVVTESLGYKAIIVSSGAIACAAAKLSLNKRPADIHSLMALASTGQISLMDAYSAAFSKHKRHCAQILLSWDDFDSRKRFLNVRHTIDKLLAMDIVPVINENDAVTDEEIKFGDNDRLSALVADLTAADILVILSDVKGLMDKAGNVIDTVLKVDPKIYSLISTKKGSFTCGGMSTKLDAAKIVNASGIKMVIADGAQNSIVSRIAKGEAIGTTFLASQEVNRARKRWIAFSKKSKGKIYVDNGAKEAILNRGKSLLGVGIIKAEGEFKKHDSVCVVDEEGGMIGCGLSNYSSEELKAHRSKKFEKEIIHRDNFVKHG